MKNKIKSLLCETGVSTEKSIAPFFPKVRDRDDVSVFKCLKSGVLFLSRSDHIELNHYNSKESFKYLGAQDRKTAILNSREDTQRRFEQFGNIIANKKWIDIGTGSGAILDQISPLSSETVAVEPQKNARKILSEAGYRVYPTIEDVSDNNFEAATLFHVFEHLLDPIGTLEILKQKMSEGAQLIIEVPHANDFLISFFDLEAFKAFTFWSEHLILHTRESLRTFIEKAGFSNIVIQGCQRYPLANHLHWLAKGKPGGHILWDYLRAKELDAAYANMLAKIDRSDTLVAIATNQKQHQPNVV